MTSDNLHLRKRVDQSTKFRSRRCVRFIIVFLASASVLVFLQSINFTGVLGRCFRILKDESGLTEEDIFTESYSLEQNDTKLLKYILKNYLIPPPPDSEGYELENPTDYPPKPNKFVMKLLNNTRNGFFVECGAWDGERLSTTLQLEQVHGWTGFLAEPNAESFAKLRTKNRKAWIANICLSTTNRPQKVKFGEVNSGSFHPALSAIQDFLDIKFIKSINTGVSIKSSDCFPIFTILSALEVTTVDFFTLDVEGAELSVLKTIPFDSILIKIFLIEYNHIPEGKRELLKFMITKGYTMVADNRQDYTFVHKSALPPSMLQ